MPHLEPVEVADVGIPNSNVVDLSGRRSPPQTPDHFLDLGLFALDMGFDVTVGAIADPSRDAQRIGLLPRPRPEENALHPPADAEVTGDRGHQTVLMSGASSAFMPTTL